MPTPLPKLGQYKDVADWLDAEGLDIIKGKPIPASIRKDVATCTSTQIEVVLLPMDLEDLRNFVRGDFPISAQAKGALIPILGPISKGDYSQLSRYCPAHAQEFQQYVIK